MPYTFSTKHINTKLKAKRAAGFNFSWCCNTSWTDFMNENSPGLSTSSQPSFSCWNVFLKNFALGKSLLLEEIRSSSILSVFSFWLAVYFASKTQNQQLGLGWTLRKFCPPCLVCNESPLKSNLFAIFHISPEKQIKHLAFYIKTIFCILKQCTFSI